MLKTMIAGLSIYILSAIYIIFSSVSFKHIISKVTLLLDKYKKLLFFIFQIQV
jgi:hypothetical protein